MGSSALPQNAANSDVLTAVAGYYTGTVNKFGPTPWGVDWTCELTQDLRFIQLLKVCGRHRRFSINDLGCGYGALFPFLEKKYGAGTADYVGIDVSPAMIDHAGRLWDDHPSARFQVSSHFSRAADFSMASGVFNVHLEFDETRWEEFVRDTLIELRRASHRGFAVNFMRPPTDGLTPLPGLYRTTPERWVGFCETELGAEVTVLRDYGLREFTLLVRFPQGRGQPSVERRRGSP